jgi:endoglucanase
VASLKDKKVRYLLPGPAAAFQNKTVVQLNPSYFAPYAFRLFAQVDPANDWMGLVNSSYNVLEQAAKLSKVGLPNDWMLLDLSTNQVKPLLTANPGTSEYGFDAYRVWWRVALDAEWFQEARAKQFLTKNLSHIQQLWRSQQKVPARIDLHGKPLVTYETTSQYAMLYVALRLVDPAMAKEIEQKKLMPQYRNGFWDNDSAYYTQNLVWFGLVPSSSVSSLLRR